MKVNKKALELIDKGLSAKTVGKLTESQINTLHKKLVNEQINVSKTDTATITKLKSEKKPFQVYEKELDEDETDDVTDQNALGATALQDLTGQEAPHDANDMAPDGMDDDSDDNRKMMGMSEEKNKPNPWAICHSQVGPKRTRKFERCVKSVKKQLEEGKNPVSLFIESIDTSNPVMAALEGMRYTNSGLIEKPKANMNDYFFMLSDQVDYELLSYNILKFREINDL